MVFLHACGTSRQRLERSIFSSSKSATGMNALEPMTAEQKPVVLEIVAPRPSLGVNFGWTLAGNVLYAAAQWLAVVILAKFGDPAVVGQFALGLAISSPILTFTNLQLRTVQVTDVGARFAFGHCLALRVLGTLVFSAVVAITALSGNYERQTQLILFAVAGMKMSEALSDVGYGLLQSRERMDRVAQSQILKAVLSIGSMLAVIGVTGSCSGGVLALAAAFWMTLLTFDVWTIREAAGGSAWLPKWQWIEIRKLCLLALPLGSTLLLASLNANIPRYFLDHYRGVREVGVFSAIAYVTLSANLFVMALGQAVAPRMAKAYEADREGFRALSLKLLLMAAGLGGVGIAAAAFMGEPILRMLYGRDYASAQSVFLALMISGTLSYLGSAAGFSLTSARYFRVQFPILIAVSLVTTLTCSLLVPASGAMGAAIGQGCGYAVQFTCCASCLMVVLRRGSRPPEGQMAVSELIFKREI
jgi:O-antigen/teichoic acid export membrane protein